MQDQVSKAVSSIQAHCTSSGLLLDTTFAGIEDQIVLPLAETVIKKGYDSFCYELLDQLSQQHSMRQVGSRLEQSLLISKGSLGLAPLTGVTSQPVALGHQRPPIQAPTHQNLLILGPWGERAAPVCGMNPVKSSPASNTPSTQATTIKMQDLTSLWAKKPKSTPQRANDTTELDMKEQLHTTGRKDAFFDMFIKGKAVKPLKPAETSNQVCPAEKSQSGKSCYSMTLQPKTPLMLGKKLASTQAVGPNSFSLACRSNSKVVRLPYNQSVKYQQNKKVLGSLANPARQTKLPFVRASTATYIESLEDEMASEAGALHHLQSCGIETLDTHGDMMNENSMEFTELAERRSANSMGLPLHQHESECQESSNMLMLPTGTHLSPQHGKVDPPNFPGSMIQERIGPSVNEWMNQIVALGTPVKSQSQISAPKGRSGRVIDFGGAGSEENEEH